jgi:hypothetical protein
MTAPRSSLVSQFLPPSSLDLCLHVGGHDDLAIAVPACVVRGFFFASSFAVSRVMSVSNGNKSSVNDLKAGVIFITSFFLLSIVKCVVS